MTETTKNEIDLESDYIFYFFVDWFLEMGFTFAWFQIRTYCFLFPSYIVLELDTKNNFQKNNSQKR